MKGLIKSAHNLHQSIVITSLTVIAFCLSVRNGPDYEAAISELSVLAELRGKGREAFREQMNAFVDSRSLAFYLSDGADLSESARVALKEALAKQNASLMSEEKTEEFLANSFQIKPGSLRKLKPTSYLGSGCPGELIFNDMTVEKICEALEQRGELGVRVVAPDRNKLVDVIKEKRKGIAINGMPIWIANAKDSSDLYSPLNFYLMGMNGTLTICKDNLPLTADHSPFIHMGDIPCELREFNDFTFRKWAATATNGRSDILKNDVRGWLPEIKLYWSELSDKSVYEAGRILREKVERNRNQHSLFGLTLGGETIVIAASGLVLLLALVLAAHLTQLSRASERHVGSESEEVSIALFDDGLSRTLTNISLLALPGAALGLALYKTWGSLEPWQQILSVGMSIGGILCCWYCAWSLPAVRRKMTAGGNGAPK